MNEIQVGPKLQLVLLAALIAAIGGAIAAQLPELRRYMKMESM
jgi:hypothetical protein